MFPANSLGGAPEPAAITDLLLRWHGGDSQAHDELIPIVYEALRRSARRGLRREHRRDPLLGTTDLVHEVYLRLSGLDATWQGRVHFFALCGRLIRQVLVDFARQRHAKKRGGEAIHTTLPEGLDGGSPTGDGPMVNLLALNRALESLESFDARKAKVVELRSFAGLTIRETAEVLDLSPATVEREMKVARAFLGRSLGRREAP